jgi:uncharacterized protein YdeI (YjbR/CyaY-like superfamily)
MVKKEIASGVAHTLPQDLKKALASNSKVLEKWESLTPLARNEWICWVTSVKKAETREEHVRRVGEDLLNGKRRPCCWAGCIHRKDKSMSPSQKWAISKKS